MNPVINGGLMERWMRGQSELSLASAAFYLVGALFSVFAYGVLVTPATPRSPVILIIGVLALFVALIIIRLGRRFPERAAAPLIGVFAAPLLYLTAFTPLELRAINFGLFFTPFFVYLIWFSPRWIARLAGYSWLGIYCLILFLRFDEEINLVVVTIAVSGVAVGELIGVFRDRLERTTLTDPLCAVWNRRGFFMIADRVIAAARRSGKPVSVLFVDLDGFKAINDLQGHAAGDDALRSFSDALTQATRPQDTLARMGGDEFALLMPDTRLEKALKIGHRLRESVTMVRWSLGAAELQPGETVHSFVARADELMLQEKRDRKAARAVATDPV